MRAPSRADQQRAPHALERPVPERARPPPPPTLVDHADLRTIYGIKFSRGHLWRLIRAGRFPPPVSLHDGGIRKCWRSRDIEEWLSELRYANTPGAAAE
jgi:predicted DNA-binding transcriptional regulator AlpA